jgi:hypothetical protein
MYEAQRKTAPIPKPLRPQYERQSKYPFATIEVGHYFFVPHRDRNNLMTYASIKGKKLGRKFATRLTYMKQKGNVWLPCEPESPGAVLGIGVWRTK